MHYSKGFDNPSIMGFDSETVTGMPYTLQFWQPTLERLTFVNGHNVLDKLLQFLEAVPDKRLIMFVYYAKFDIPILLYPHLEKFALDTFELQERGWEIKVFCSKSWWVSFYHKPTGKYVQLIDIFNFFKGGLAKVAKELNIKEQKLPKPARLGEYCYKRSDKIFVRYAMQDAKIAYRLGKLIVEMHKELDIPVCLSAPKMAELTFRSKFLHKKDEYLLPKSDKCLSYSLHCYHGAKNGYYLDHPALFDHIFDYDIISAYPYAMSMLPSFLKGKYEPVREFVRDVINYPGVYYVVGKLKPCRYGVLATPGFRYVKEGGDIKTFATGYEILEALRSKELRIDYINGFIFRSYATRNPLQEYVEYFYKQKSQTKKKTARYELYKLLLNSLYGKWIQTNPIEQEKVIVGEGLNMQLLPARKVAAGLFNPFIASLITGFIRAELHRLEHKYRAIETSTDSFKTQSEIHISKAMQRLGGLEKKFSGKALFCRNRLNLLLGKNNKVESFALHGFWGKTDDLYNLYLSQTNTYVVRRIPLVRETLLHSGKTPFVMNEEVRTLNVNWKKLRHYRKGEKA